MRRLLILVTMLFGVAASELAVAEQPNPAMKNILQGGQKVRVSNQQAASKIKRSYPNSKILSLKLIESNGPPVYRIKILSDQGEVKVIFVDGINSEIFE